MDDRARSTKTEKGLGQNGLYWKLMRRVALHRKANGENGSVQKLMDEQHVLMQTAFNFTTPFPEFPDLRQPKGTSHMSVTEFSHYFEECEKACVLMWDVSPFEEKNAPFDHGGIT